MSRSEAPKGDDMSKKGQHDRDAHDPNVSKGHNKPDKSVTITTGSVKKQETYEKQIHSHEDTNRQPQAAKNEWNEDTRKMPDHTGATRAREIRSDRSGSDSNRGG